METTNQTIPFKIIDGEVSFIENYELSKLQAQASHNIISNQETSISNGDEYF